MFFTGNSEVAVTKVEKRLLIDRITKNTDCLSELFNKQNNFERKGGKNVGAGYGCCIPPACADGV